MKQGRPAALVIHDFDLSGTAARTLKADTIYVVVYDNKPINYVKLLKGRYADTNRYRPTVFVNRAWAYKLADRLNQATNSQEYSVKEIVF